MRQTPIYKIELSLGLADKIKSNACLAYTTPIEVVDKPMKAISDNILKNTLAANKDQVDLYYLKSILATIGWNKNDDIFDKIETWAARATPEDKPFNYEHNPRDVIGHITDNYVIDLDGNVIDNDTPIDDVPNIFHVVTSSVLYKYSSDKEQMERMKKIIAEIPQGKWFVSMEALFDNFDYGVQTQDGQHHIIARTEESAFLSKYLRAYGGDGVYEGNKIGRVLRNLVFSGKGLVLRPANPHSIIFDNVSAFDKVIASSIQDFKKLGYTLGNKLNSNEESNTMASENTQVDLLKSENERLEKTVNAAVAKAEAAEKRLTEMNEQTVKAKIDGLTQDVKARDDKITSLTTQVQTEQKARTEAETKIAELTKQNTELQTKVATVEANAKKSTRIAVLSTELGMNAEDAGKFYDSDVADLNLSDDRFTKFVTTLKAQKGVTNTDDKAKAEAAAKAKADAAKALENAQPTGEIPALGTDGVNNDVEQTRAAFGDFLATSCLRRGKKSQKSSSNDEE
jgi:hypothetical protein